MLCESGHPDCRSQPTPRWACHHRLVMSWKEGASRGSEPATRVLVVDDEQYIRDLVGTSLRYEGFEVEEASMGRAALAAASSFRPDLIVLDVMLPDLDGLEVTRRLRTDGVRVPVLFLTARDATEDKVAGLTVGGDDYVTKPFSLDEDTREVWRGGVLVHLTATEFNLLRYFMLNPRRVLSKVQILEHVWQYDFEGDPNVLETYISYLRKKLDPLGPPLIHTSRQVG